MPFKPPPQVLEVLEQQQARIVTESRPTALEPPSPEGEAGVEPSLYKVEVPSTDTLTDREGFLEQLANNEDASTAQQLEVDPLMALLHTKMAEGGEYLDIIEQLKEQLFRKH